MYMLPNTGDNGELIASPSFLWMYVKPYPEVSRFYTGQHLDQGYVLGCKCVLPEMDQRPTHLILLLVSHQ